MLKHFSELSTVINQAGECRIKTKGARNKFVILYFLGGSMFHRRDHYNKKQPARVSKRYCKNLFSESHADDTDVSMHLYVSFLSILLKFYQGALK